METATLTKNEEAHVERMAEAFSEPTMSERFSDWAARSIAVADKEKKGTNPVPRKISLEDRSDDEKKFIAAVGKKEDEPQKKTPAKDSAEKDAAKPTEQHADAKKKPDGKPGEAPASDSPIEPVADERYWEAKFGGQEDHDSHWNKVSSRIGVALAYIDQHKDKAQIEQGLRGLIVDRSAVFQRDLYTALAEVPNPGEVLHHFALHSKNREVLRNAKTSQELRSYVQQVSKASLQASPKPRAPEVRPRAPKPPSEVGGRGAAGDGGTRAADGFTDFSERMQRLYAR